MPTYIGDVINQCRRDTNNTDVTSISTEDFLRYANYAQENLQAIILQCQSAKFQFEAYYNITSGQDAYSLPDNTYMGDRIVNVEYTFTGNARDYHKIYERGLAQRSTYPLNYIEAYIRRSGQILVQPMPSATQGILRVTAERQIDRLDIRRGIIDAVTGTTSVTALSLDVSSTDYPPSSTDIAAMILTNPYICISDKDGIPVAYNIPVSAYNTVTGDLTITATDTISTPAAGQFITFGKYTRTHTELDTICERYITAYMNWKIFGRDTASSAKAKIFENELSLIKEELTASYSETDHDEDEIQIVHPDLVL